MLCDDMWWYLVISKSKQINVSMEKFYLADVYGPLSKTNNIMLCQYKLIKIIWNWEIPEKKIYKIQVPGV